MPPGATIPLGPQAPIFASGGAASLASFAFAEASCLLPLACGLECLDTTMMVKSAQMLKRLKE
jgi:hypothetical protein